MPVYEDVIEAEHEGIHRCWTLDGSAEGPKLISFREERISFYTAMVNALFDICEGNESKANVSFSRLLRAFLPSDLTTDIIRAIDNYGNDLSRQCLLDYAHRMMKESDDIGMVKIALIIVSGFFRINTGIRETVRALSAHPELCWYCFRIIFLWPDGEEIIRESVNADYLWSAVHGIHHLDCSKPENIRFILKLIRKRPDAALLCAAHICGCADFPSFLQGNPEIDDVLAIGLLMEIYSYGNDLSRLPGIKEISSHIFDFAKDKGNRLPVLEVLAFLMNRNVLSDRQREAYCKLLCSDNTRSRLLSAPDGYEYIELGRLLDADFDQMIIERMKVSEHPADLLVFIRSKDMFEEALDIVSGKGNDERIMEIMKAAGMPDNRLVN